MKGMENMSVIIMIRLREIEKFEDLAGRNPS
jgi:hypothetical protein